MSISDLQALAVPSVCVLIATLAYGSQFLFFYLEPGPLSKNEAWTFNVLVICIWWSYERACRVEPGKLPAKKEKDVGGVAATKLRWCRKCDAVKPERAHHCKQCKRCIPKMDHHCPWTSNCVSHTTFPHFLRFILYASVTLSILDYYLYIRAYAIYEQRNLPSYLGPSMTAIGSLLILLVVTTLVLFALTVLVITAIHSLFINTTMIETWEIERHEALVRKARKQGGYIYGPSGVKIRIQRQEFPFDIGFWQNAVQGMGTSNIIAWLLPFGGGPSNSSGWAFETNGFENPGTKWPPIDPDKMSKPALIQAATNQQTYVSDVTAFKKRQQADLQRYDQAKGRDIRQQEIARATIVDWDDNIIPKDEAYPSGEEDYDSNTDNDSNNTDEDSTPEETWTSRDGSRLRDFGVDEDAEAEIEIGHVSHEGSIVGVEEDEDDIPLGELMRRRKRIIGVRELEG